MVDSSTAGDFDIQMRKRLAFRKNGFWVLFSILLTVTVIDRLTKIIAQEILKGIGPDYYLGPHYYFGMSIVFVYQENAGAFLGIGANLSSSTRFWIFVVGISALLLYFCYRLFQANSLLEFSGWVFIISGGLSNLTDRLLYDGYVIDFLRVSIGGFRTGIFNVADVSIVVGFGLLLGFVFKESRESSNI